MWGSVIYVYFQCIMQLLLSFTSYVALTELIPMKHYSKKYWKEEILKEKQIQFLFRFPYFGYLVISLKNPDEF